MPSTLCHSRIAPQLRRTQLRAARPTPRRSARFASCPRSWYGQVDCFRPCSVSICIPCELRGASSLLPFSELIAPFRPILCPSIRNFRRVSSGRSESGSTACSRATWPPPSRQSGSPPTPAATPAGGFRSAGCKYGNGCPCFGPFLKAFPGAVSPHLHPHACMHPPLHAPRDIPYFVPMRIGSVDADWCLQSDGMTNSGRQGDRGRRREDRGVPVLRRGVVHHRLDRQRRRRLGCCARSSAGKLIGISRR